MKHVNALSRNPVSLTIVEESMTAKIREAQEKDCELKAIRELLNHGEYEDYLVQGRILYKIKDGLKLLVVPRKLQYEVIRRVHGDGHFVGKKLETRIHQSYFITSLSKKIEDCVRNCIPCILAAKKGRSKGYLNPIPKEPIPIDAYHLDHLEPMTATKKGYRYVLAVVDAFTKFTWIYPVKSTTTEEVIQKLTIQQAIFGNLRRIITDKGTAFTSSRFRSYCEKERIELIHATTGVPRGNGHVERIHQVIISVLTKL